MIIKIVGVIALVGGMFCFSAWVIMLIWGALAGAFGGPTISYPLSLLVALALSLFSGGARKASS